MGSGRWIGPGGAKADLFTMVVSRFEHLQAQGQTLVALVHMLQWLLGRTSQGGSRVGAVGAGLR